MLAGQQPAMAVHLRVSPFSEAEHLQLRLAELLLVPATDAILAVAQWGALVVLALGLALLEFTAATMPLLLVVHQAVQLQAEPALRRQLQHSVAPDIASAAAALPVQLSPHLLRQQLHLAMRQPGVDLGRTKLRQPRSALLLRLAPLLQRGCLSSSKPSNLPAAQPPLLLSATVHLCCT